MWCFSILYIRGSPLYRSGLVLRTIEHSVHIKHNSAQGLGWFVSLSSRPLPGDNTFSRPQQHSVASWSGIDWMFYGVRSVRTLITWSQNIFDIKLNNWAARSGRWYERKERASPFSQFNSHVADHKIEFAGDTVYPPSSRLLSIWSLWSYFLMKPGSLKNQIQIQWNFARRDTY